MNFGLIGKFVIIWDMVCQQETLAGEGATPQESAGSRCRRVLENFGVGKLTLEEFIREGLLAVAGYRDNCAGRESSGPLSKQMESALGSRGELGSEAFQLGARALVNVLNGKRQVRYQRLESDSSRLMHTEAIRADLFRCPNVSELLMMKAADYWAGGQIINRLSNLLRTETKRGTTTFQVPAGQEIDFCRDTLLGSARTDKLGILPLWKINQDFKLAFAVKASAFFGNVESAQKADGIITALLTLKTSQCPRNLLLKGVRRPIFQALEAGEMAKAEKLLVRQMFQTPALFSEVSRCQFGVTDEALEAFVKLAENKGRKGYSQIFSALDLPIEIAEKIADAVDYLIPPATPELIAKVEPLIGHGFLIEDETGEKVLLFLKGWGEKNVPMKLQLTNGRMIIIRPRAAVVNLRLFVEEKGVFERHGDSQSYPGTVLEMIGKGVDSIA